MFLVKKNKKKKIEKPLHGGLYILHHFPKNQ